MPAHFTPIAVDLIANPLAFQAHPEVWLLVAFLVGAYVYTIKVIGPLAVEAGQPVVTRRNKVAFIGAIVTLWGASDWPVHDIAEKYLYSMHMVQHMILSYFLPPLVLLATPTWVARAVLGEGHLYQCIRRLSHPVVAGVLFNVVVMIIHIPMLVNAAVGNGPLHYSLHILVVIASLLMWMPVCGPVPEFHISVAAMMIYLFLQSVVPTIPAAWLTFAEGIVYHVYDKPVRLWGISAVDDQQLAGAAMKVGGSVFLWTIVIILFFRRFSVSYRDEHNYRRTSAAVGGESP